MDEVGVNITINKGHWAENELEVHKAIQTIQEVKDELFNNGSMVADSKNVILYNWLSWIQDFLKFFATYFLIRGEYKKPPLWKWPVVITQAFILGIRLISLFNKNK